MNIYRRLFGFVTISVALTILVWAMGTTRVRAGDGDNDGDDATCSGGSVAAGVYSSLKIAGACTVDAGSVNIRHDLTLLPNSSLVAVTGGTFAMPIGSNVRVGGNVEVQANSILILGCEPVKFICGNDPDQSVGTYITNDTIGGNLTANNALTVITHNTVIRQDASIDGGGGGVSCANFLPVVGAPPYADLEDDVIEGEVRIHGWQSCWLGLIRDTITGSVRFNDNVTADPDGNEVVANRIIGNLKCSGDNPSPQIGDSGGELDRVFGHVTDQCANPALVH